MEGFSSRGEATMLIRTTQTGRTLMRRIDVHRQAALTLVHPMSVTRVSIEAADTHVLAHDVRAPSALPRWDNSAMDGYAVRRTDVAGASTQAPVALRVLADLPAGSDARPTRSCRPGRTPWCPSSRLTVGSRSC